MKLQRFAQIGQRIVDRFALTNYVDTHCLRYMPVIFLPYPRHECLFRNFCEHATFKFVQRTYGRGKRIIARDAVLGVPVLDMKAKVDPTQAKAVRTADDSAPNAPS